MPEPIIVDLAAHTATRHGQTLPLSRIGFRVLATLATHAGRTVPHAELYRIGWQNEPVGGWLATLNMNVTRVRKAMGDDGSRLCAVRGVGYLLVEGVTEVVSARPRGELPPVHITARLNQAHELLAAIAVELSPQGRIGTTLLTGRLPRLRSDAAPEDSRLPVSHVLVRVGCLPWV